MTTPRRITPHKGGRTARIPSGWILPETLRRIHEAKREQGKSFADLIEEKFSGGNTMIDSMSEKHVYGWYRYEDGTDKEFRYPAALEDDLRHDSKHVIVEVKIAGAWDKRKARVNWGGGNFVVTPR